MTSKQASTEESWEVVSEPRSRITFDTVGDEWEGFYEGPAVIHNDATGEDYDYLNFRDSAGDPYMVSASYDLARAFANIPVGTYSKMILTGLVKSTKGSDAKLYKVLTRK